MNKTRTSKPLMLGASIIATSVVFGLRIAKRAETFVALLLCAGCVPKSSTNYVQDLCSPELELCEPVCSGPDCRCGSVMMLCCIDDTCYAWDEASKSQRPTCDGIAGVCLSFVTPDEPPFDGSGVCYDVPWG